MVLAIFILSLFTSLLCGVLLLRGYRTSGHRLLLWAGLCFVALGLENVVLILDMYVIAAWDLSLVRLAVPLVGLAALLYGLLWEAS